MRDSKLDGMQDFDTVIKSLIERKAVTLEDGLAFATNPHNLQLALKGVSIKDDFIQHDEQLPAAPPRRAAPMLDLT
jgi:twitching motility protein PilT